MSGVRRHLIDHAFDREDVEHVADGAPVLEADAVRDAAHLDLLVGHVVVGDLDAGDAAGTDRSPTTQCFQPVTVPDASVAASTHWNDCGRNMPWAMSSSRVQISLTGLLRPSLAIERAFGGVVADRAPAEAAAQVALVEVDLLFLEAERLGDRSCANSSGAWLPSQTSALSPASLMRTTAFNGSICA